MGAESVFELGKLSASHKSDVTIESHIKAMVFYPMEAGKYPIVVFLHGTLLHNSDYTKILHHVASHGFILVAPQLPITDPCSKDNIREAKETTDWLPNINKLHPLLPSGVVADLNSVALAGHSRGGSIAFALALAREPSKYKPNIKVSALIGIDPVAGMSRRFQFPIKIFTDDPQHIKPFDLGGMPVMVIGSGLGDQKRGGLPIACAPDGVNHKDFYDHCSQSPSYHFLVSQYGHLDVLDAPPGILECLCKEGKGCKALMRRTVAGLVVAFLNAYFGHGSDSGSGDLKAILHDPQIAPTELHPVESTEKWSRIRSFL